MKASGLACISRRLFSYNAALTRGTQLAGPEAMQASDIGVQWPGWCRQRRRQRRGQPEPALSAIGCTVWLAVRLNVYL